MQGIIKSEKSLKEGINKFSSSSCLWMHFFSPHSAEFYDLAERDMSKFKTQSKIWNEIWEIWKKTSFEGNLKVYREDPGSFVAAMTKQMLKFTRPFFAAYSQFSWLSNQSLFHVIKSK